MKNILKSTILAASLAVAGLAVATPNASAANAEFSVVVSGGGKHFRSDTTAGTMIAAAGTSTMAVVSARPARP